jgi:hypothetical protein
MRRHHTRRRRPAVRSVALVVAAMLASVLAMPSVAATAGPSTAAAQAQGSLSVQPSRTHPSGHVVIAGLVPTSGSQSCPAEDPAVLTSTAALFPPDGFGPAAPRSASGQFKVKYVVPSSTPPGTYVIGVRCGGGNTGLSATLRVV